MSSHFVKALSCVLTTLLLQGCGSVINAMIPADRHSNHKTPELVCVNFGPEGDASAQFVPALLAPLAAEGAVLLGNLVVNQTAKGLEEEAKRYKDSYSGRASSHFFQFTDQKPQSLIHDRIALRRYWGESAAGKACPFDEAGTHRTGDDIVASVDRVTFFTAKLDFSGGDDPALRIIPEAFDLRGVKAKVSWFKSKVDVNIRVALSMFTRDEKGAAHQYDIGQVDFPLGTLDTSKIADGNDGAIKLKNLERLASPWLPLPALTTTRNGAGGLVNLTIAVMESDDFGDVIQKGSKTLSDNSDRIVQEFVKLLGLKKDASQAAGEAKK